MRRVGKRLWVTGLLLVWAAGLLAAAVWSAHHDAPTVRPQSDLATGRQSLDDAVAAVVETAGPLAKADVRPYELATGCRITVSRRGTELAQTVVLTVPGGQEQALLDRLVEGLPEQWRARYRPGTNRFFADAGEFVAIRGEVAEPGQIRLTAATGCRPGTDPELSR